MNIDILKKWNEQYLRLSSFNRKARRTLKKRWKKSLLVIALALALGVSDASAATINVGVTSPGIGAVTIDDTDNICSITEALQNANDTSGTAPNDDCETGDSATGADGADIILLPSNSTFTFNGTSPATFLGYGQNALPLITSNITIEGNGSVLERMEDPLPPGAPIPDFRIVNILINGNLTVNNSLIRNGDEFQGGCVNVVGRFELNNSEISGCNANAFSGGGINNIGNLLISNSLISENSSAGTSGGINHYSYESDAKMDLINSTVSGNTSEFNGGGIAISLYVGGYEIITNIINSTISNNTTNMDGGGLNINTDIPNIRNSIISGNISRNSNSNNCNLVGTTINDLGNNLSDNTGCGFTSPGSFDNDCLGPLAENGVLTRTHALIASGDQQCSTNLAIDGIPANECVDLQNPAQPIIRDQRGFIRPFPVGGNCDIGSYEFQPLPGSGMCNMAEIPGDMVDNNGDGESL